MLNSRINWTVWDAEGKPPDALSTAVLWRSFDCMESPGALSVPRYVEEHADVLRARYLAWIHDLGEARIGGRRLIDHLELRPGFSYWWMTLIAQKFNASGHSPVNDAIKLLAFEELLATHRVDSVRLISGNDDMAASLQVVCANRGVSLEFLRAEPGTPYTLKDRLRRVLPLSLQAIIGAVRYMWQRRSVSGRAAAVVTNSQAALTFVDVLVHLDRQALSEGRFISHYWTDLVDKLGQAGLKSNWLHHYFRHEATPSFRRSQQLAENFNSRSSGTQCHAMIDASMGRRIVFRALRDYLRLRCIGFRLRNINRHYRLPIPSPCLWPLFQREWSESLRGQTAIVNCFTLALIEWNMKSLPLQKTGIYIQENQPWEMALIYAWKAAGHGMLIGAPHTTVRYWDLRYFYDARSYRREANGLPMPDKVAVNGPSARGIYIDGNYPQADLADVEALRFRHLLKPQVRGASGAGKALRVLVCGDFLAATNQKLLSWLSEAASSLPSDTSYVLKPHPAYPIARHEYAPLSLQVTNAPLDELFADCSVVFTSNITSVAVDAYCAGLPVIQMLDGGAFNMSPLRGLDAAVYVTNPSELAEALRSAAQRGAASAACYFLLDPDLPRWRHLLGLHDDATNHPHAAMTADSPVGNV